MQLKKKRRRLALAGCVPVALCACIIAAVAVPDRQPAESCVPNETGCYSDSFYGMAGGDMAQTVIEVTGSGSRVSHSAAASVSKILETIDRLLPSKQDEGLISESFYEFAACGGAGYTIEIKHTDGSVETYLLQGDSLIDCGTGDICNLNEMELQILKTVLGIAAQEE